MLGDAQWQLSVPTARRDAVSCLTAQTIHKGMKNRVSEEGLQVSLDFLPGTSLTPNPSASKRDTVYHNFIFA